MVCSILRNVALQVAEAVDAQRSHEADEAQRLRRVIAEFVESVTVAGAPP